MRADPRVVPAASAGFALSEMLVTVALISLLSIVVFAAASQIVRTWSRASSETREARELVGAVRELRALLAGPIPMALPAGPNRWAMQFAGAPDRVDFIGIGNEPPVRGAVHYSLRVDASAAGQPGARSIVLCRDGDIGLPLPNDLCAARSMVLTDLESAAVSYAARDGDAGALVWRTDWNTAARLPDIIRLQAQPRDRSRSTIDLWVPVMTAVGAPCLSFPRVATC